MQPTDIDVDSVFEALSTPRRRLVLRELAGDTTLGVDALAERCVESDRTGTGTDYRRVYLSLIHVDLPKLDRSDLVRYDHDDRTVAATESLAPALDAAMGELERLRAR